MAMRPTGICSDLSDTAAPSEERIQLGPVSKAIYVTEFGISLNAAPNSTVAPVEWNIRRDSTAATGSAGTIVKLNDVSPTALTTAAIVEAATDGSVVEVLHRLFVPNVSGVIWVAAPGREFDCLDAEFIAIDNVAGLGTGIFACTYMVWEE